MLWGIGFGLFATVLPLFLKDLGATPTDIGLVIGVGNVAAALSFLPIGLAADRWGRKPFMVLAWCSSTLGALLFLPITEWRFAFAGSLLYWVGGAALPLVSAHIAATVPRARLGTELGVIYGSFFLGTILASPFAGQAAATFGLRGAMTIGTAAFLLSTISIVFVRGYAPLPHAAGPPLPHAFWVLLAITPLAALIANIVNPLFPVYVRDVADVPLERVGVYIGLVAAGAALLATANGRVADLFGAAPAVITAGVLITVGASTIALAGRSELALGIGALLLGAQQAANPVLAAALERILPPSRATLGYSAFQLVYAVGFGTGGILSGVLYDLDALLPLLVQLTLAIPVTATIAVIVVRIVRPRPTFA